MVKKYPKKVKTRTLPTWQDGGRGHISTLSLAPDAALCHGKPATASREFYYFGGWIKFCIFPLASKIFLYNKKLARLF